MTRAASTPMTASSTAGEPANPSTTGGYSAAYSAGYLGDYLTDGRRCGECAHSAGEHWTAATASFDCTRPACGCMGWWSSDLVPEPVPDVELPAVRRWVGPPVVTLCGSMRFWPLMLTAAANETAAGAVVLAPFIVVPHAEQHAQLDDGEGRTLKVRLDALHRAKIAMSSLVLVVTDPSDYWGESTQAEIAYAHQLGVPVEVCTLDPATGHMLAYRGLPAHSQTTAGDEAGGASC